MSLAHRRREAFHDDHFGLDFGEPGCARPHRGIIGVKGVLGTDEHQALSPVPVAGDKRNQHNTAQSPGHQGCVLRSSSNDEGRKRSSLGKVKGVAALTEASISIPTSRPHRCFFYHSNLSRC
jgi:hypothetical protein